MMKTKIFSLCMIFFVLLVCTTVTASDNSTVVTHTDSISSQTVQELSSNTATTTDNSEVKTTTKTTKTSVATTTNKKSNINKKTTSSKTNNKNSITTTQSSSNGNSISSGSYSNSINSSSVISSVEVNNTLSSLKTLKTATKTYSLNGTVTCVYDKSTGTYAGGEEDGLPVSGAKVTITNQKGKVVKTLTTNSKGYYIVNNLASGYYNVNIKYGTYKECDEDVHITNKSDTLNHVFIPDIAIISYSGGTTDGQRNKVEALKKLSDRVYFLESYNLNSSYDVSHQWMLDYSEFILVDMYAQGLGFGVDVDLIKNSPASQNNKVAYTFGIFDNGLLMQLGWGYVGGNPHSLENTYVGSYWQAEAIFNDTIVNTNMKNLYKYILYLLGDSDENPTETGDTPILAGPQWGVYYPGYTMSVPTPSSEQINKWIQMDPGYNDDGAGSLNWMTNYYNPWVLENQQPVKVFRTFENWYNKHSKIKGSFVVIISYYQTSVEVEALIKEFEKQGRAAFCLYQYATVSPTMTELLEIAVTNKSGFSRGISAGSSLYAWSTSYTEMGTNATVTAYQHMNITILNALSGISEYSYYSEYGPQSEWTYKVTISQFEGVIGAIPISYLGNDTNSSSNSTNSSSNKKVTKIIQSGVEKHVQLVNGWATLKEKENSEKKIAIVVYDYPPGKANIGASYLDVFTSVHDLLVKMAEEGYDIGMSVDEIPTTEELSTQLIDIGNKGNWASGYLNSYVENNYDELVKNHQLINSTDFKKMFNSLPSNLQEQLVSCWGTGLGNGSMIYKNTSIVIPGIYYGNVFITIQPARGWDSVTDYHSDTLSPPQQYVAFYKYLYNYYQGKTGNSIDAMVSMGTHGTLEWLPGRTLGLQESDWPFQLIESPIIYPYIVSNPGEGMTAKERSFAQVITHMTPVTTAATLYGEYTALSEAISSYDSNKKLGDTANMQYYKEEILNLTSTNSTFETPNFQKMSGYIEDYNYALEVNDIELLNERKSAILNLSQSLNKSMLKYFNFTSSAKLNFSEYLEKMYEYVNSDEAFEAWLETVHSTLEGLTGDTITYGVHTLGYVWNSTEMVAGITTISSSRTNILQDIMEIYFNIEGDYYKKIQERDFAEYQTAIESTLTNIVTSLVDDTTLETVERLTLEKNQEINGTFYNDLVEIKNLIDSVRDNREWESIMTALSGGYVIPGLSGEPAASDVLPTGRSMYSSDTTKMPSKAAWTTAVASIDQTLTQYMQDMGEDTYPELVAEVIWGTEVLRTEGISLAQYLYLLGVKPTWDRTGKVNGTEIIPLEELTLTIDGTVYQRPRIDVFATIVSNNPYWLSLLQSAVDQVNALNESIEDNFVKKHYAETNSTFRLFGLNGNKLEGTGVSDLLNNIASWQNSTDGISYEAASVYEARIGNAWTVDSDGNIVVKSNETAAFVYLLSHVDLVIQDLDSTWRYLDSDDYTDWYGGLINAANVHGATPNTILLDIRNRNNIVTSTLTQEISKEVRTTFNNPQWLEGMTSSVGGWNQMSGNWENLHKTIFTTQGYEEDENGKAIKRTTSGNSTGAINNNLYTKTVYTLVYSEYLIADANYKSYAIQSMIGWSMTLAMNNYWKTTDTVLVRDLIQKYVDAANKYGVACCHHTCGNINLHEWILKTGSQYGVKGLEQYSREFYAATNTGTVLGDGGTGDGAGSGSGDGNTDGGSSGGNGGTSIDGSSFDGLGDTGSIAGDGAFSGLSGSSSSSGAISEMSGSSSSSGSNSNGNSGTNGNTGDNNGNDNGNSTQNGDSNGGDSNGNGQNSADGTGSDNSGSSNSDSSGNSTNQYSGDSDVGVSTAGNGASSAGGSSTAASANGATSAMAAVYEVNEKSGGQAASAQSEIALGYILSIVGIAGLFFIGFRRSGIR